MHDFSMRVFLLLHKPEFAQGDYTRAAVGDEIHASYLHVNDVAAIDDFNAPPGFPRVFKRIEDDGLDWFVVPAIREINASPLESGGHPVIIMSATVAPKKKRYTLLVTRHS